MGTLQCVPASDGSRPKTRCMPGPDHLDPGIPGSRPIGALGAMGPWPAGLHRPGTTRVSLIGPTVASCTSTMGVGIQARGDARGAGTSGPRSPLRTRCPSSPANCWWCATTRCWPPVASTSAKTRGAAPSRSSSAFSARLGGGPASCSRPPRSPGRSDAFGTGSRWPGTSVRGSGTARSSTGARQPASSERRRWTGSTSWAPATPGCPPRTRCAATSSSCGWSRHSAD